MLMSHEMRFVFIHIPKTAGMSVHRALAGASPDAIRRIDHMPAFHDPQKHRHLFARDMQQYLGAEAWRRYFSFCFVRNPYSRLVSWYNMCLERPVNAFMWRVRREAPTFYDFLCLEDRIVERTRFNQVDYVTDQHGRKIVNFIGNFESLSDDFDKVCTHLGLRSRLPHLNSTAKVDYRTFYDERCREIVAKRFQRDLTAFGYSFETPAPMRTPLL
jgi:chondroitin 4-sulfotransferase 11